MKRNKTTHIVLHTAAWPGDPDIEDIRRVHVDERGWNDVGYHYLIRKDGTIEKGRPESHVGAHCRDGHMNLKSIGICLSGHHDIEEPTTEQLDMLCTLVNYLRKSYDIDIAHVIGHREAGAPKTCPGELVDMDELRARIEELYTLFISQEELEELATLEQQLDYVKNKTEEDEKTD